jgi:integrase
MSTDTFLLGRRRRRTGSAASPATVNRALATLRRLLRLAYEWKETNRVPKIRLLNGERTREFVLSRNMEQAYLAASAQPLRDIALLILKAGLRIGEALNLAWADVELEPLAGSRFGYIRIRGGKSKNARRTIPLIDRAAEMLRNRKESASGELVFSSRTGEAYLVTSINHLHQKARAAVGLGGDFVIHSLRQYNVDKARRVWHGRLHDHAYCGAQQHLGFSAARASDA